MMRKNIGFAATLSLAILALLPSMTHKAQERAEAGTDACRKTSEDELKGCLSAARATLAIADARCENLASAADRKACKEQAAQDARSAAEECKAQNKARLSVCRDPGAAPYAPSIDPANFVEAVDHPYFPLHPGTTLIYENRATGKTERTEVRVTTERRVILGVTCTEVRSTTTVDGVLDEDAFDWFAQDREGNVWYFGENSLAYVNGLVVDISGSWMSGENGAKPGIVMEAHPRTGRRFRQEYSPGSAEAVREVLALDGEASVPAGSYTGCAVTEDFSALEPDAIENKVFAPGVGLVKTVYADTGDHEDLIEIIAPKSGTS